MLTFIRRRRLTSLGLITGCLALLSNVALAANGPSPSLYSSLARSAPELNPTVLKSALSAVQCAVNNGEERSDRLAVIDYSQPSTARRLWIFDLRKKTLVLRDLVAHGAQAGRGHADHLGYVAVGGVVGQPRRVERLDAHPVFRGRWRRVRGLVGYGEGLRAHTMVSVMTCWEQ